MYRPASSTAMVSRGSVPVSTRPTLNVGRMERLASVGAGIGLLTSMVRGGSGGRLFRGLMGAGLIYRGVTGYCPMYGAMGFDSAGSDRQAALSARRRGVGAQEGVRVEKTITVARAPGDVYEFWRRLENLPLFMSHLESVREIDLTRSRWVAKGPLGARLEWDAEIINERPGEMIAWESLPGSEVETAGSVHFTPAATGFGTDVRVNLKYRPAGGKVGIAVASLLGQDAESLIENDLDQMRRHLEGAREPAARENG